MLRLTFRNVWAHKLRFLLTTFAVVMGVGFVVGSFIVTDSLRSSVGQLFDEITAGVDATVRAETSIDATNAPAPRGRIPADLVATVRGIAGVEAAEGAVGGYAQLLDLEGRDVAELEHARDSPGTRKRDAEGLGAHQDQPGLVAFLDEVIVERLAVLDDGHAGAVRVRAAILP